MMTDGEGEDLGFDVIPEVPDNFVRWGGTVPHGSDVCSIRVDAPTRHKFSVFQLQALAYDIRDPYTAAGHLRSLLVAVQSGYAPYILAERWKISLPQAFALLEQPPEPVTVNVVDHLEKLNQKGFEAKELEKSKIPWHLVPTAFDVAPPSPASVPSPDVEKLTEELKDCEIIEKKEGVQTAVGVAGSLPKAIPPAPPRREEALASEGIAKERWLPRAKPRDPTTAALNANPSAETLRAAALASPSAIQFLASGPSGEPSAKRIATQVLSDSKTTNPKLTDIAQKKKQVPGSAGSAAQSSNPPKVLEGEKKVEPKSKKRSAEALRKERVVTFPKRSDKISVAGRNPIGRPEKAAKSAKEQLRVDRFGILLDEGDPGGEAVEETIVVEDEECGANESLRKEWHRERDKEARDGEAGEEKEGGEMG